MESRVKLFGHAVHPMLIVFPLGLLATAVIFDIIYLSTRAAHWAVTAYWMIAAGVIGGLAAALFGWVDWFAIPARTRARAVGLWHGLGNALVLLLFALSWYLRSRHAAVPDTPALVLSFAGVGLALVTSWLGGELVERLRVGVDDGANVDAPSSLAGPVPGAQTAQEIEETRWRQAG